MIHRARRRLAACLALVALAWLASSVGASLLHPTWVRQPAPRWTPRFGACAVAQHNTTFMIGGAGHFQAPGPSSAVGCGGWMAWMEVWWLLTCVCARAPGVEV